MHVNEAENGVVYLTWYRRLRKLRASAMHFPHGSAG